MFKKVFVGVALSTMITGGALALGATAASAWTNPTTDVSRDNQQQQDRDNANWWNNDKNWLNNQDGWWGQNAWKFDKTDHSAFGVAAKDIAVGFQDKTDKDDWYNNQNWWNRNNFHNDRDDKWWDRNDRTNKDDNQVDRNKTW